MVSEEIIKQEAKKFLVNYYAELVIASGRSDTSGRIAEQNADLTLEPCLAFYNGWISTNAYCPEVGCRVDVEREDGTQVLGVWYRYTSDFGYGFYHHDQGHMSVEPIPAVKWKHRYQIVPQTTPSHNAKG